MVAIEVDRTAHTRVLGAFAARGADALGHMVLAATEEAEKLNIWGAAMGLEQRFGSAASLEALVKRAVSVCEPKRAHERLLAVLAGATSTARAEAAGSAAAGGGAKRQGVRAEAAAAAQEAALHKVMCKNYKVRERLRCRCCCFEMCG